MRHRGLLVLMMAASAPSSGLRAQPQRVAPLTSAVRQAVVDSVRHALLRYYVFPDTGRLMASALASRMEAHAYDSLVAAPALAAVIAADLRAIHRDAHMRIVFDPEEAQRALDTTRRESRDRLAIDRRNNFFFRDLRILPGNIGYIEFTQFADTSVDARKTVRSAMQYMANTDALIIDLRDNRGGSAAMASELASYFVSGRAHWSDSFNRIDSTWTASWVENKVEITGGLHLSMPVTVLTSSWTFSGAEGLAYALQNNRGARIVGERTAGGAHVLRRVALGNGFVGFIPYRRSANVVTGTDWEGTGVAPNIVVDAPNALLAARIAILEAQLTAAKDSNASRAVRWAMNSARADAGGVVIAAQTLDHYAGRFEEYQFTVLDACLYAVNTSRNNKLTRLRPISATLFEIDAESQIEFIVDTSGVATKARLLWNDGAVDLVARTTQ